MPVRALAAPIHRLSVLTRTLLVLGLAAALVLGGEHTDPRAGGDGTAEEGVISAEDMRPVAARTTKVRRALRVAKNQIGDPYRYGGAGPNQFDCSGLVYYSTRRAGFKVPRTSSAQARHMKRVKKSNMKPGDFVYFHGRSGVYHAAVYVGRKNGKRQIVHAPGSGQRVKKATIWTSSWSARTLRR